MITISGLFEPYDFYVITLKNRSRIVIEINHEMQKRGGNDFPVFVKMNAVDFCKGYMIVDEAI